MKHRDEGDVERVIGEMENLAHSVRDKRVEEVMRSAIFYLKSFAGSVNEKRPYSMDIVPKNSTMIKIAVINEECPLEDTAEAITWTIGFCSEHDNEIEGFQCVGWTWSHDEFVSIILPSDKVVGWLPFDTLTQPREFINAKS